MSKNILVLVAMMLAMLFIAPTMAYEFRLADIPEVSEVSLYEDVLRIALVEADMQGQGERISLSVDHAYKYLIARYLYIDTDGRTVVIGNRTAVIDLSAIDPVGIDGIGTSVADMKWVENEARERFA